MARKSTALLGAMLAAACLVKNVELVDELPGAEAGRGGSTAGTNDDGDGGDARPTDGGSSSMNGGSSTSGGVAVMGGTDASGGTSPGGGSNPGGGTDASGGSSSVSWMFGDKAGCDTEAEAILCDDFETERASNWAPGPLWTRPELSGAPSPSHVMQTGFREAAFADIGMLPESGFHVSFWVRFPSLTDQPFIAWSVSGVQLWFGLEESAFRFRLDSSPATVAPEQAKYTRGAVVDKWTCVELNVPSPHEVNATVTVFGEQPFELATLGGSADAGIDRSLLESIPGGQISFNTSSWVLGHEGTDIQIDDVRFAFAAQPSVCDDFLAANR